MERTARPTGDATDRGTDIACAECILAMVEPEGMPQEGARRPRPVKVREGWREDKGEM
jgi:hypothetical protein